MLLFRGRRSKVWSATCVALIAITGCVTIGVASASARSANGSFFSGFGGGMPPRPDGNQLPNPGQQPDPSGNQPPNPGQQPDPDGNQPPNPGQQPNPNEAQDGEDGSDDFSAAVVSGEQIYACKDGAFAQENVRATLERGIDHSFVTPAAGPPQWRAPDGSAVTGALREKKDNGEGNIPELVLDASQAGGPGILSGVTEIQRNSTSGGVAPERACQEGETVAVPYQATYVFVKG